MTEKNEQNGPSESNVINSLRLQNTALAAGFYGIEGEQFISLLTAMTDPDGKDHLFFAPDRTCFVVDGKGSLHIDPKLEWF